MLLVRCADGRACEEVTARLQAADQCRLFTDVDEETKARIAAALRDRARLISDVHLQEAACR